MAERKRRRGKAEAKTLKKGEKKRMGQGRMRGGAGAGGIKEVTKEVIKEVIKAKAKTYKDRDPAAGATPGLLREERRPAVPCLSTVTGWPQHSTATAQSQRSHSTVTAQSTEKRRAAVHACNRGMATQLTEPRCSGGGFYLRTSPTIREGKRDLKVDTRTVD